MRLAVWLALGLLGTTGCIGSRGYFSGPHALLPAARSLKSAYPVAPAVARELNKSVTAPYIVEPGDVLQAQAARLDSPLALSSDLPVLPDGRIQLGRYGLLEVAGKTIEEIEAEVNAVVRAAWAEEKRDDDEKEERPTVVVRLVTRDSKLYYVLGEVNSPGAFPLRGRETVLDAIVTAGGLNSNASRRDILLSRPTGPDSCREVLPVCYDEIVQLGDTSTNYQLRPGDRIFVPTRTLAEMLCLTKPGCPPCGKPQVPCADPACPAAQ